MMLGGYAHTNRLHRPWIKKTPFHTCCWFSLSLEATTKPHHKVQTSGVVLGYSHMGMLAAARWLMKQVAPLIRDALDQNEGYRICLVGEPTG